MHINTIYAKIRKVLATAVSKNRNKIGIHGTDYFGWTKNELTGRPGLYLNQQNLVALVVSLNQEFGNIVITLAEMQALADGQVQDLAWKIQSKYP